MSEGSGVHNPVKPESQSIKGCMGLREECQGKIFKKMDDQKEHMEKKMDTQHQTVMGAIGNIDKKFAFMEGQASAQPTRPITSNHSNGKKEWKQFMIQAVIQWGPVFGLIVLLGLREWLKSKGWM